MVTDDTKKATVLNAIFSTVFTQEKERFTDSDCSVSNTRHDIPTWLEA